MTAAMRDEWACVQPVARLMTAGLRENTRTSVRRLAWRQRWQGCEIARPLNECPRRLRVLCHLWHERTWTQEGVHSLWEWGHRQRAPQGVVPVARAQMDRREGPFTLGVKEDMTLASASETVDLHTRRFFYRELVFRELLIIRSLHGETFKFSKNRELKHCRNVLQI